MIISYGNVNKSYSLAGNYILATNGARTDSNITIITNAMKLKASYGGNVIFNAGTDGTIVFPTANKKMTSDILLNLSPMHVDIMLARFNYGTGGTLKSITFT